MQRVFIACRSNYRPTDGRGRQCRSPTADAIDRAGGGQRRRRRSPWRRRSARRRLGEMTARNGPQTTRRETKTRPRHTSVGVSNRNQAKRGESRVKNEQKTRQQLAFLAKLVVRQKCCVTKSFDSQNRQTLGKKCRTRSHQYLVQYLVEKSKMREAREQINEAAGHASVSRPATATVSRTTYAQLFLRFRAKRRRM